MATYTGGIEILLEGALASTNTPNANLSPDTAFVLATKSRINYIPFVSAAIVANINGGKTAIEAGAQYWG